MLCSLCDLFRFSRYCSKVSHILGSDNKNQTGVKVCKENHISFFSFNYGCRLCNPIGCLPLENVVISSTAHIICSMYAFVCVINHGFFFIVTHDLFFGNIHINFYNFALYHLHPENDCEIFTLCSRHHQYMVPFIIIIFF